MATRKEIDLYLCRYLARFNGNLDFDTLPEYRKETYFDMAKEMRQGLSDLGVVKKVERELPHPWRDDCMSAHSETCKTCDNCDILEWAQFDLIESGYVVTVPLIKEE